MALNNKTFDPSKLEANATFGYTDTKGVLHSYPLWVEEFSQTHELKGDLHQSALTRKFYPKSYGPGDISITLRCKSQEDLAQLGWWIRTHQRSVITSPLFASSKDNARQLILFNLPKENFKARGWVSSITIINKGVFEQAPQLTISFTVAFNEHSVASPRVSSEIRGWTGIIKSYDLSPKIRSWIAQSNLKNLISTSDLITKLDQQASTIPTVTPTHTFFNPGQLNFPGVSDNGLLGIRGALVKLITQYLGVPYVAGGDNPSEGFDCSGLVQYVYKQVGIDIPRTSETQFASSKGVDVSFPDGLLPGDVIFFKGDGTYAAPGHEALYIGGGYVIESPRTGGVVQQISLKEKIAHGSQIWGAKRFVNA